MKVNVAWATLLLGVLVLIAAAVGGAVVVWGDPGALSFQQYLDDLEKFAVALGLLGVGRGIAAHGKHLAGVDDSLSDETLLADLDAEPEARRTHA